MGWLGNEYPVRPSNTTHFPLQVSPQSWSGDRIVMRCTPIVRPPLGPHATSLAFDANCCSVAFHVREAALYAPDAAGFLHRFRVRDPPAAAVAWPCPPPAGIDGQIRSLDFGPDGEMYAATNCRVFRFPPAGGPAELLAGGGPAGNDATGPAAGFGDT